jgi:hypothetical protein
VKFVLSLTANKTLKSIACKLLANNELNDISGKFQHQQKVFFFIVRSTNNKYWTLERARFNLSFQIESVAL